MSNEAVRTRPRAAVAFQIFPDQLERLRAVADVVDNQAARVLSAADLAERLADVDGALISVFHAIDAPLLAGSPRLRTVANVGVGINHIDLAACSRAGVAVTNTPGVVDHPTADLAFALMLAAARRVVECDAYVRGGRWTSPIVPIMGLDIHHRTLGIVGLGRIGRQLARRAAGFDMNILYTQRRPLAPEDEAALGVRHVGLDALLAQSDFVIVQVPYGPETHHLIGARELALMKPSAVLVNTARGGVVDDAALAAALKAGRLGGAGLDVVENEPAVHPALLEAPNLVLMPHVGSATLATRHAMVAQAVDNLIAGLHGRTPPDLVNPDRRVATKGSNP